MPSRRSEFPDGTDHIIKNAMETSPAGSNETGRGSARGSGGTSDGAGFIGKAAAADDTGGTSGGRQDMEGKQTKAGGTMVEQLRGQTSSLRDQASERVRDFAESGKARTTEALDELSKVVSDAAESIDQRLGGDYGEYARRASDAVAGFADTLRNKDVDELYDNVRSAVRKSPGVAIGIAAVVGFTLIRLIKAGLPDGDDGNGERRGDDRSSGKGA